MIVRPSNQILAKAFGPFVLMCCPMGEPFIIALCIQTSQQEIQAFHSAKYVMVPKSCQNQLRSSRTVAESYQGAVFYIIRFAPKLIITQPQHSGWCSRIWGNAMSRSTINYEKELEPISWCWLWYSGLWICLNQMNAVSSPTSKTNT